MKFTPTSILFTILLLSCTENNSSEQTDEKRKTTEFDSTQTSVEQEIKVKDESNLFNMNPPLELVEMNKDYSRPTIHYYSGNIGGSEINLILNELSNPDKLKGNYIYTKNGSSFEIEAKTNQNKDSIFITRYKKDKVREVFKGEMVDNLAYIKGDWVKGEKIQHFELMEEFSTPEQTQMFINLNSMEFVLTDQGIALKEGFSGMEEFNSFTFTDNMGSTSDFEESWSDYSSQVFFENNTIVHTKININNTIETIFEETDEDLDHEVLNNLDVIGTKEYARGKIIVSVIQNGITTKDTIPIDVDYILNPIAFKKVITLNEEDGEKSIVYKWNGSTLKFEKL